MVAHMVSSNTSNHGSLYWFAIDLSFMRMDYFWIMALLFDGRRIRKEGLIFC